MDKVFLLLKILSNQFSIEYICKDKADMAKISQRVDKHSNSIVNRISAEVSVPDDFEVVPQTKPDPEADRLISEYIRKDKLKRAVREVKYGKSTLSKNFDALMEKLKNEH